MGRIGKFSKKVYHRIEERGVSDLIDRVPRNVRQRLPIALWPPLLIDPRNAADEVVTLPEKPSLTVSYDGQFNDSVPRQLANFQGTISSPENAVYVYEDADVVGRYPVARIEGEYLLPSWFGVDTAFFLHQNKYLKRDISLSHLVQERLFDRVPERHIDTGFLVLDERGSNLYGWFHETLPKLRWYEEYCESTGERPVLILNSPLSDFQRQSLEWMGYEPDSWIEHGNELSRVDRLVVAPHPIRLEGNPSSGFATEVSWAGHRIRSNLPSVDRSFSDRIYVSRADANRRRVRNEGEVMETLGELGFERYIPGQLSLAEQVALFAGADVVVGLHGLAFFNLMYCDEGTAFVELFAEDGVDESYFVVANELDMEYEFMICDSYHEGENKRPINKDVHVDTDRLETIVTGLLEDSRRTPRSGQTKP